MTKPALSTRTSPLYTVSQAARLAGTTPQTARRWLLGYRVAGHSMQPVFSRDAEQPLLSFLDLIELVVAVRFRRGAPGKPMPLERVRSAHHFMRGVLRIDHPFASTRLRSEGGHILHDFETADPAPRTLAVDLHGNYVLPNLVTEQLEAMDFASEDGLAVRWFPAGKAVPIVVAPGLGTGLPVVQGTNLRVSVIKARFDSGVKIEDLAVDFDLDSATVQAALRAA